jgi:hypothetical protein
MEDSDRQEIDSRIRKNEADPMLASIPGEQIAKAAMMLPDAETAADEPQHVEILHASRWIRITFKRFKYKRGKTTRWFWTAESAELLK